MNWFYRAHSALQKYYWLYLFAWFSMQHGHQSQTLLIALSCTCSRIKQVLLNIECFLLLKKTVFCLKAINHSCQVWEKGAGWWTPRTWENQSIIRACSKHIYMSSQSFQLWVGQPVPEQRCCVSWCSTTGVTCLFCGRWLDLWQKFIKWI